MVTVTKYVWDPVFDCVISEHDGTGSVQAVYTHEPQQYGGVISQRRATTSSTYHADALGTTRALTNATESVTDTYLYDAWGNQVASTGTTVNPFRWLGRYGYYQDSSTGLVYVRARMYQPTVARWCSVDPLSFVDRINVYEYVRSSPLVYMDSAGLYCEKPQPRTESQCCEDAENAGLRDKRGRRDGGGIVCCDGRWVSCVWTYKNPLFAQEIQDEFPEFEPQSREIKSRCLKAHEDYHIRRTKYVCPSEVPSLSRPDAEEGIDIDKEECMAYKIQIRCLTYRIDDCKTDRCKESLRNSIEFLKKYAESHYYCTARYGAGFTLK